MSASDETAAVDDAIAAMTRAEAALGEGDFAGAIDVLEAATEASDGPEVRVMLGGLCHGDDEFAAARDHWECAFKLFADRGDRRNAVRVAANLVELHGGELGNHSVAQGWYARAARLLDAEGRCPERGYLELAYAACDVPDVDVLLARAELAIELAHEFGDHELAVRALADSGYALVCQGWATEGFARLDEAMATILAGEVNDQGVVALSFCAMLSACDRAGAAQRAQECVQVVHDAVLDRFGGRPKVLHTHCRVALGSVLCSVGRWSDAESTLLESLARGASVSPGHRSESIAQLALLRIEQGRIEQAADLVRPLEDRVAVCLPLARVHLLTGEIALAAATIQRGLDDLTGDRLRSSLLLALLVQVELARDDIDAAEGAADALTELAAPTDVAVLHAEASFAHARVAAARGDHDRAAELCATALRTLGDDVRPLLAGAIRYERAEVLASAGDQAGAIAEARAACAIFDRLGATMQLDRAGALLRSLGAPGRRPSRPATDAVAGLTARERDVLDLVRAGLTNAEIGERLFISAKTVEHHVSRVLSKLGVRSRAEAAAVAATLD